MTESVNKFAPGERVTWNDDNALPHNLIRKSRALYGGGPFTIFRVHDVPPQDQRASLHPQQVIIKELIGFTYTDSDLGRCTTEGVFSGAFFKPV